MTTDTLSVSTSLTILKPASAVFEAIRNPVPFFVARASAPMAEGTTVTWVFPEFPQVIPIIVEQVAANDVIRMQWDAATGGKNTVDFRLAPLDDAGVAAARKQGLDPAAATTVTVTESGWPDTPAGRESSHRNLMGWTQMICALKAHLEHGVNLRTGAFLHFKF